MNKHRNWKQQRHTEAKQRKALKRRREMKRRASGKLTPPVSKRRRLATAVSDGRVSTLGAWVIASDMFYKRTA